MAARSWPSSPLDAAARAWDLLVTAPTQLGFDGRGHPGLPDRTVRLDELRDLLLAATTPRSLWDPVWRELVDRARRDGPAWVVVTVGMALPGLRRLARQLTIGWRGDTADLDSELLVGFVARLKTIDLDAPRVVGRLLDAALRAGRKARDADSDTHLIHVEAAEPTAPIAPWDHPDLVLARAVAAAVIDADEAHLIGSTRLGLATLAVVGAELGISASRAWDRRRAAERRLVAAITAGDLAFVPLRTAASAAARRPRI
jgi:hypothetical protein